MGLFYVRQMPIFEVLGMMFEVSRTTANNIFHYWLPILRNILPSTLLEEWQKSTQDEEFVQALLTNYQLLVDSAEQPTERPLELSRAFINFSQSRNKDILLKTNLFPYLRLTILWMW